MKSERAINITKGCVMASFMDSEKKQMVIEALNQVAISKTETVWDVCSRIAGNQDNMQELVWRTMKENHINDPGNVQPGTELVIRVKEMK